MKKLNFILAVAAALALITTSCSGAFNPPAVPQGPQSGQPQSNPPQPGEPLPGQPLPGQPPLGHPQPGQPQSGMPQPGQQGQPQPEQPPQPGQPGQPSQPPTPGLPQPTLAPTTSNPTATPNLLLKILSGFKIISTTDLQLTDLSIDDEHHLHARIRNNSTYSGDIAFAVSCSGTYIVAGKSANVSYSGSSVTFPFNANQERNTDTGIQITGIGSYNLTCTVNETGDPDSSNNKITRALQVQQTQIDLELTDLSVDTSHYLVLDVKDNSAEDGALDLTVSCSGTSYPYASGNPQALSPYKQTLAAQFNAHQTSAITTTFEVWSNLVRYDVDCTISSPYDLDTSNNRRAEQMEPGP